MFFTQFKLRSLLLVMTIAAIFANPIYDYSVSVLRSWNQPDEKTVPVTGPITIILPDNIDLTVSTVVNVPDGGYVIMGGLPPIYTGKSQQAEAFLGSTMDGSNR